MKFRATMANLPFCCGFMEVGNFEHDLYAWNTDYTRDTPVELIDACLEDSEGRPVMFNFIHSSPPDLVEAVRNHKNSIHVGEWSNPNGGNKINCYIIKDYNVE